jgi:uncharacterized protein YkwD
MKVRGWKSCRHKLASVLTVIQSRIWVLGLVVVFVLSLYLADAFVATNSFPVAAAAQQEIICPSETELEVVELLNQERAKVGLPRLVIDMRLMESVRRHSTDMATNNFFSHTGSDGSSPFDRISEAGYSMRSAGENIAGGYRTAEAAVQGWMNSDGHRANILNSSYEHIGVGYIYGENASYGHYWTTNFGSTNDTVQSPPNACWPSVDPTPTPTPTPGTTFADVPLDHPYYDSIEALYQAGYTSGCSSEPLMYCPERIMNRAESAVFVERGIHGSDYDPPDPAEVVFADVTLESWYADWAHGLWEDGYTAGCGTDPLIFCPGQEHTRAEATVFYLRMMYGADYEPPEAVGHFTDVGAGVWYARWVDSAYETGIAEPCATEPELRFCPEDPLTRAVAAYMMVQAKDLLGGMKDP